MMMIVQFSHLSSAHPNDYEDGKKPSTRCTKPLPFLLCLLNPHGPRLEIRLENIDGNSLFK